MRERREREEGRKRGERERKSERDLPFPYCHMFYNSTFMSLRRCHSILIEIILHSYGSQGELTFFYEYFDL